MKKGKKVGMIAIDDPAQILALFKAIGMEPPEELKEALDRRSGKLNCGNPLCPACLMEGPGSADDKAERVGKALETLTHEELLQFSTVIFGVAASAYMEAEGDLEDQLGESIARSVALFRKRNEKFNFATARTDKQEEVAKH